jgi:hypothetical protein
MASAARKITVALFALVDHTIAADASRDGRQVVAASSDEEHSATQRDAPKS